MGIEILYQRGLIPKATFFFKHALIQEAAYQSLLRTTRRQYHHHIAEVIERQFPETCDSQPELLAYHYTEAALPRTAVDYWQRAASQAFERAAFLDAEAHVRQGLLASAMLMNASERYEYELVLQARLGAVLLHKKPKYGPEVLQTLKREHELCEKVGNIPQFFDVIRRLWFFYIAQGQLTTASELGGSLIKLAQQQQDSVLLMEAHRDMGTTRFFLGEQSIAAQHFEQSHHYNSQELLPKLTVMHGYGVEISVLLSYYSWGQWITGYIDQSLKTMNESLILIKCPHHIQNNTIRWTHCFILASASTLHQWRREPDDAYPPAEASTAIADLYDAHIHGFRALALQGWALAQRGQHEEGIALIQCGIAKYRAQGAVLTCTHMLAMLAESYGAIGEIDKGLDAIAEALDLANTHDERWWEAELHRLQAELRLQRGQSDASQVEADLQRALTIARRQAAKSLELRAATSLARLWQSQGKHQEAYNLLAPVYKWFTEGFDTADLQDAEALLHELERSSDARPPSEI